jgi:cytosine/adenosine deaminase-related metal-dependent hydrolase
MPNSAQILGDCRLPGRAGRFDVTVAAGCIREIAPAGTRSAEIPALKLDGKLLLPALTDGHLHLDKSFLGLPWRPHLSGDSIASRIAAERAERALVTDSVGDRARRLISRVIGFGTLALRSHIDVDEAIGLAHVEALLALRAALAGQIDIQLVAFPQSGINRRVAELLEESLRLGVDVIGGLDPAGIDGDIEAQLDTVFGLAERHGRLIDIHLHDPGALGCFELRRIAARAKALGMQGRVAVSHAYALGMVGAEELRATVRALAQGGVAIMTNGPGAEAMPPLHALLREGVVVFAGCDNIRDAWSPFGSGDLLQRAGLIGWRGNFRSDEELRLLFQFISANSRAVMGLPPLALTVGAPADLIAVVAEDIPEAVASPSTLRLVWRAGRLLTPVPSL